MHNIVPTAKKKKKKKKKKKPTQVDSFRQLWRWKHIHPNNLSS
jgi:hypothetical protein